MNESYFSDCNGWQGGAIYSESPIVSIKYSDFIKNRANYGAAIFATNVKKGKLKYSALFANTAQNMGAGIFLDSQLKESEHFSITKTNFTKCRAGTVGAIECWGGTPKIKYCEVERCASTHGLAAVRTSSVTSTALLNNVLFFNCTSRQYGCAFSTFQYQSKATLTECIFKYNSNQGTNGTSVWIDNKGTECKLIDCIIYGNPTRQFGSKKFWQDIQQENIKFIYDPEIDYYKDTPAPTRTKDVRK